MRASARSALLVAACAAVVPSVSAAPCALAPLATYTVSGYTCEVGTAVFSNVSFFLQNGGGGNVLDPDTINVSPLLEPGLVGLRFSGNFQSTGGPDGPGPAEGLRSNIYRFFFSLEKSGSVFTGLESRLNDPLRIVRNPLKFGDIFAANYAANDGALAIVHDDDPGLTISQALNSQRTTLPLDNLIQLTAGASAPGTTSPVGFASLDSADFLFAYREVGPAVPEPATWPMVSATLLLLLALRRWHLLPGRGARVSGS